MSIYFTFYINARISIKVTEKLGILPKFSVFSFLICKLTVFLQLTRKLPQQVCLAL